MYIYIFIIYIYILFFLGGAVKPNSSSCLRHLSWVSLILPNMTGLPNSVDAVSFSAQKFDCQKRKTHTPRSVCCCLFFWCN